MWECSIILPPGDYQYKVLVNQYLSYSEQRVPAKRKLRFQIPLEAPYHNGLLRNFAGRVGGYSIVRIVTPDPKEVFGIEVPRGSILYQTSTQMQFGTVFEFCGEFDRYRFVSSSSVTTPEDGYLGVSPAEPRSPAAGIIYQIFPDRFLRVGSSDGSFQKWGTKVTRSGFFGGNLRGITSKIEYIASLGTEYIYLNPINRAGTNHRYDVLDYYKVDPILGSESDFRDLVAAAHSCGIGLILDMVFNHVSENHPFFRDAMENGTNSKYFEWFHIHRERETEHLHDAKNRVYPLYESFQGHAALPKLNVLNPETQGYLEEVAHYWINEFNVDGLRFDVADSISLGFFREMFEGFQTEGTSFLKIGEAWCTAPMLVRGDLFDGLMNYPLRDLILDLVNCKIGFDEFAMSYRRMAYHYSDEKLMSMMNLLGSHDVMRARKAVHGNEDKFRLAYAILYVFNGLPNLYYGDEAGLTGGRDPDCRRCFPWENADAETQQFFMALGHSRIIHKSLSSGVTMFQKKGGMNSIAKIRNSETVELDFTLATPFKCRIYGETILTNNLVVLEKEVEMQPFSFVISRFHK